jgi:zinc-ribbon domain
MRSIKRGRGQSAMGAFGSLYSVVFGIIWTIFAFWIGGNFPFPIGILFPLFGVCFVIYGIVQTVYQFNNATRGNRFSEFDIVDGEEEPDPLNQRFGRQPRTFNTTPNQGRQIEGSFCPYCRANLQADFEFCPKCGADI